MTTLSGMNRKWGCEIELVGLTVDQAAEALWNAGIKAWNDRDCLFGPRNGTCRSPTREEIIANWRVVTDGSVPGGAEVVSPILSGDEGLENLRRVVRALKAAGASVDNRCGFHVHVDAKDLETVEIINAVARYAQHEALIDGFMAPRRRGERSQWCHGMSSVATTLLNGYYNQESNELVYLINSRYYKLNIAAFVRHGTLEFRQHAGTMNINKMVNWIIFCVNFIEKSRMAPEVIETVKANGKEQRIALLAAQLSRPRMGVYKLVQYIASAIGVSEAKFPEVLNAMITRYPEFQGTQIVGRDLEVPATAYQTPRELPRNTMTLPASPEPFEGLPVDTAEYLRSRARGYASPLRARLSFQNGSIGPI